MLETTEYKCLQSQFSVLYNESMQIRTQLEEARNQLSINKNTHLRQIEHMEVRVQGFGSLLAVGLCNCKHSFSSKFGVCLVLHSFGSASCLICVPSITLPQECKFGVCLVLHSFGSASCLICVPSITLHQECKFGVCVVLHSFGSASCLVCAWFNTPSGVQVVWCVCGVTLLWECKLFVMSGITLLQECKLFVMPGITLLQECKVFVMCGITLLQECKLFVMCGITLLQECKLFGVCLVLHSFRSVSCLVCAWYYTPSGV